MRYLIHKGRLRRVRTPEGAKFFGAPIGTIITPGMAYGAKRKHGDEATYKQFRAEDLDARISPHLPQQTGGSGRKSDGATRMVGNRTAQSLKGLRQRSRSQ